MCCKRSAKYPLVFRAWTQLNIFSLNGLGKQTCWNYAQLYRFVVVYLKMLGSDETYFQTI